MKEIEIVNRKFLRVIDNKLTDSGQTLYDKRVLQKNTVEGLIPFGERRLDGKVFHYYFIEGMHSMKEAWKDRLWGKEEMTVFIDSLKEALESVGDFLLRQEQLLLDPAYIMYDGEKRKWRFLYLIESYDEQGEDVQKLMEFFLSKLSEGEEEWFYDYYTECMQYGVGVQTVELVRLWNARNQETVLYDDAGEKENCYAEEGKPQEISFLNTEIRGEVTKEATGDNVEAEYSWKTKWNKLVYAKLYLVPYSPS